MDRVVIIRTFPLSKLDLDRRIAEIAKKKSLLLHLVSIKMAGKRTGSIQHLLLPPSVLSLYWQKLGVSHLLSLLNGMYELQRPIPFVSVRGRWSSDRQWAIAFLLSHWESGIRYVCHSSEQSRYSHLDFHFHSVRCNDNTFGSGLFATNLSSKLVSCRNSSRAVQALDIVCRLGSC